MYICILYIHTYIHGVGSTDAWSAHMNDTSHAGPDAGTQARGRLTPTARARAAGPRRGWVGRGQERTEVSEVSPAKSRGLASDHAVLPGGPGGGG